MSRTAWNGLDAVGVKVEVGCSVKMFRTDYTGNNNAGDFDGCTIFMVSDVEPDDYDGKWAVRCIYNNSPDGVAWLSHLDLLVV